MTEPVPEASDIDRAEQAAPVSDSTHDAVADDLAATTEADPADLHEQHQDAPLPEDDYDR